MTGELLYRRADWWQRAVGKAQIGETIIASFDEHKRNAERAARRMNENPKSKKL